MSTEREARTAPGDGHRWDERFWPTLGMITAAAGLWRAVAVLSLPRPPQTLAMGISGDGFYYYLASDAVAAGHGFVHGFGSEALPDAEHPPLWTALLAVGKVAGATTVHQSGLLSAAVGTVAVLLIGLAGRRLLSPRTGLIAAAIGAVYPGLWIYERNLNAEVLLFPLVAAVILLAYRYRSRPTLASVAGLAAVAALLVLTRSEQILVVPFLIVPMILGRSKRSWTERVGHLMVAGMVFVVFLAPWTIYNLGRLERPVLLSAGAGTAMLAGTCDETFGGEYLGSYAPRQCLAVPEVLTADITVRDPALRDLAVDYTSAHLDRFPGVALAREGRTLSLYRVEQTVRLHAQASNGGTTLVWIQVLMFWAMLPAAAIGTVALRRRHIAIYPLYAFAATVVISTAVTFGDLRYRAPAEVPLLLLAACGIDVALHHLRRTRAADVSVPGGDRAPVPFARGASAPSS